MLADFGLVLPPSGETTRLTSVDSNWGSIKYCAPEQAIEFRNARPTVDIYSFGCILHDIFGTGARLPYGRCTADGSIGDVVEKCTEPRPERRFQTISSVRGALLSLIGAGLPTAASAVASDWKERLGCNSFWQVDDFRSFVRFLARDPSAGDLYVVLRDVDEELFEAFERLDSDLFKSFSLIYAEWIGRTGFDFAYCDVLVHRLETLFSKGDAETKAECAIAMAELGVSHNRWFVMGRLLYICGIALEDAVARRIAIEIAVREAKDNFVACVQGIDRSIDDYHPRIAAAVR